MIYRASIGDLCVLLDDEMIEERPTPEVAYDYLTRVTAQVVDLYQAIPDTQPVAADGDG